MRSSDYLELSDCASVPKPMHVPTNPIHSARWGWKSAFAVRKEFSSAITASSDLRFEGKELVCGEWDLRLPVEESKG